jgi:CobQ-like glutamine amidotransferase family enzyme
MDVNGDYGNLLTLLKRMQWRGIPVRRVRHNVGDEFPERPDLIFGGGGEITEESEVQRDMLRIDEALSTAIDSGAATLVLGGSFQLFGRSIKTAEGKEIAGLSLFNMRTVMEGERFTGNVVAESERFGTVVGFENHMGKTELGQGLKPFARVVVGSGNNEDSDGEGVHYRNAIGSYLFGPLLPKNPAIADYLITRAVEHAKGERVHEGEIAPLTEVDDCAARAAEIARSRPRGG